VADTAQAPKNQKGEALLSQWNESGLVKTLCLAFGAFITLIALSWAIELPLMLGFEWLDEQAMVACFGLMLVIVFIRFPAGGGKERLSVPW
jgi:hypothetical protein